jgi:hypothetical protein
MSEELLISSLLYYAKYPFLPKAREFVKNFNLTLDKLLIPPYNNILERAIKRIEMAYYFGFIDEKLEKRLNVLQRRIEREKKRLS